MEFVYVVVISVPVLRFAFSLMMVQRNRIMSPNI